ncbi:MAG: glycoside hydrolase family 16 protein [Cyclobacteriaceae bacterium]|jgi:beta-glucanase (GH16 family)
MRLLLLVTCLIFLISCAKDEVEGPVVLRLATESLVEGSENSNKQIIILRDNNKNSVLSLTYQITHLTTEQDLDLQAAQGTIVFEKGQSEASIPIQITGDPHQELSELFKLTLQSTASVYEFQIVLFDDDQPAPILSDALGFFTPAEYPSMKAFWSDEFDGPDLNLNSWTYDIGNGCPNLCNWGNNELQLYGDQPNTIRLSEGKLIITAINDFGIYRSARIKTKGKVETTYGRIDIRARLPRGKGIWPAFWMLGSNIDTNPWPGCGEIDMMELIGSQPETVHGTVHYENVTNKAYQTSTGSTSLSSGQFYDSFHVFTTIWDRNRIDWYLDNELYGSFSYPTVSGNTFRLPYYFLINMAVGGRWPGSPDDKTVFPQELIVDYIRVFQ